MTPTAPGALVAVMFGGGSAEHVVSLKTGATMVAGLGRAGYEVVPVLVGRDGRTWSILESPDSAADLGAEVASVPSCPHVSGSSFEIAAALKRRGVEVVLLGLHGPGGEDGSLQGFLQTCGFKYSGPGVAASAVAMDKLLLKRVLKSSGLPTADWLAFDEEDFTSANLDATIAKAEAWTAEAGWPVVLKALNLGSSVGVAIVSDATSLRAATVRVLKEGAGLFLERALKGPEVSCGVFGRGAEAFAFPSIEIIPQKAGWFDFESKYAAGGSIERIPAQISAEDERRVREIALRTHRLIGADGVSRTDMIVTEQGPVVLETNTLPGMTAMSLIPQEARAIGWSIEELLRRMVENARGRP